MKPASRREWWFCLVIFLVIHVALRTWLFTGSVPNPADDGYSGYKANALIHSSSWPTMLPEAPELPMAYYYYPYEWPAAFAVSVHVPLRAGWWATAIVLCVTGGMLVLELVLPRLRTRQDLILGSLVILNGCGISFLLALVLRMGPKDWMQEQGIISSRYGLYLRVPQGYSAFWDPFIIFATGILVVAVFLLWRLIEERKLGWPESIFTILALASLPGYCTFHLIGFILVVLPVLTVAAIAIQRGEVLRRWFPPLIALGIGALLLCFPLIFQLIHRVPGARQERFKDPLYDWLPNAPAHFGLGVIAGLALLALFSAAISNLLVWPVLFRCERQPLPGFTKCLIGIFFLGTFVCFFGVIDDFVPKFGHFIAVTAILAFLTLEKPPKWAFALMVCGLIGPSLLILNTIRANIAGPKQDPLWRTLDRLSSDTHEIVLYDVPYSVRRQRVPWQNAAPFFSRIQFLAPADEVDDQDQNFMVDPAQLKTLPPTPDRVRELAKGAPTYLLLRTGTAASAGERLYSDDLFSLDRVKLK